MLKNLSMRGKLMAGFISVAIISAVIGGIGYRGMMSINNALTEVGTVRLPSLVGLGIMNQAQTAIQRAERTCLLQLDQKEYEHQLDRLKEGWANADRGWKLYEPLPQTKEEEALWKAFVPAWEGWKKDQATVMELIRAGKIPEARRYSFVDERKNLSEAEGLLKKITDLNIKVAEDAKLQAITTAKKAKLTLLVAIVIAFCLAVGLGVFISRAVYRQLGADPREVGEVANRVAVGDLDREIVLNSGDTASVMAAMKMMVETIRALVADTVMLSDAAVAGKLATRADAARHQGDFRKIVAGVNDTLDAVIGPLNVAAEYVDRISKGDIPPQIVDNYQGDFNEIKNNLNVCIAAVDALVADAKMLSVAAVEGKLATRADASRHRGDFQLVVEGVNQTLDAVIGPLNVAAEYVDRISKGDIPPRITETYRGDFNEIKNNLNTCIDAVNALVADADMLSAAAVAGQLASRADAGKHRGDFRKIVDGVNRTLDAVIGPLNVAAEYVDRISKGDVPPRISENYCGDFNEIKNNLNVLIDAMETVTEVAALIARGDLAVEVKTRSQEDRLMLALKEMVVQLKGLAQSAERIAAGDLTVRVTPASDRDLMGNAFAAMVENLGRIVGNVSSSTDAIAGASREIAEGSADLAQRTEEQAASLEETAASMEELTSTVKQNADNSQQANQLAIVASDVAVRGGAVIGRVVTTMDSISDSSKKIADIIGVIDGIAFQTNILALNAAVEAARAGEQGRGFAVVAGEVRNLAQRSAAAAKEIKSLISDSVDKVGSGAKLVAEAGQTMQEIVVSIKRVTDIMGEISAASTEQSAGIEQVNIAITTMDEMTQQNSSVVQQAAAAAEALQEQAQLLVEAVGSFTLEETGKPTVRAHGGAAALTNGRPGPLSQPVKTANGYHAAGKANGYHKAPGREGRQPVMAAAVGDDADWNGF